MCTFLFVLFASIQCYPTVSKGSGSQDQLRNLEQQISTVEIQVFCLFLSLNMYLRVHQLRCAVCINGSHVQPMDGFLKETLDHFKK